MNIKIDPSILVLELLNDRFDYYRYFYQDLKVLEPADFQKNDVFCISHGMPRSFEPGIFAKFDFNRENEILEITVYGKNDLSEVSRMADLIERKKELETWRVEVNLVSNKNAFPEEIFPE